MNEKINRYFTVVCIIGSLLICAAGTGGYFIGQADRPATGRVGLELGTAEVVNREIAVGQQRTIELNRRAIATVERSRGITEEADRSYAELGELNRGSSDISKTIREENKLLADYIRRVSGITSDYFDNLGGE
jgi:hypothetical protein